MRKDTYFKLRCTKEEKQMIAIVATSKKTDMSKYVMEYIKQEYDKMNVCPICKKSHSPLIKYCSECGTKLKFRGENDE